MCRKECDTDWRIIERSELLAAGCWPGVSAVPIVCLIGWLKPAYNVTQRRADIQGWFYQYDF